MKRFLSFLLFICCAAMVWAATPLTPGKGSNGKWGFHNRSGQWAIQPKFDGADNNYTFTTQRAYAVVKMGDLWGCVNTEGNYITQPVLRNNRMAFEAGKYAGDSKAYGLYDGYDAKLHLWGFTDAKGQFVIAPTFDEIDVNNNFHDNNYQADKAFAIVKLKGFWGAIDNKGYLIVKPYLITKEDALSAANEVMATAPLGKNIYTAYDPDQKKYGFVNYKGNWVVKPTFAAVDMGYTFSGNRPFAVVKYNNGWGCINAQCNFFVKPTYGKQEQARAAAYKSSGVNKVIAASELQNFDDNKYKNCLKKGAAVRITDGSETSTVAAVKAPTVRILTPKDGEGYSQSNVTITYEAKTFDGSAPQVQAYVNGELVSTKGVQRTGKQMTLTLPRSSQNVCRIQLYAKDAKGQNSDPASITLHYIGAESKPQLHIMAVGVNNYNQTDLRLQKAANDARDFVETVEGLGLNQYDRLATTVLLTDSLATDRNIKRNLSQLVTKVNQGDVVLLFFSGHGAKEGDATYFLPVNAESNDLFSTSVNFDDIKTATRRLKDKKCRIIVFMDACHSGALYGQKSVVENYALSEPGIIGFYSSTASQKSNESEKWKNGIFTKALLEGLKGKAADANGDITLDKLEAYIRETVRSATNGAQMPIFENKQGNFVLFNKKEGGKK